MIPNTMNDEGLHANGKVALNDVGRSLKSMPRIYFGIFLIKLAGAPTKLRARHLMLCKLPSQDRNWQLTPLSILSKLSEMFVGF